MIPIDSSRFDTIADFDTTFTVMPYFSPQRRMCDVYAEDPLQLRPPFFIKTLVPTALCWPRVWLLASPRKDD
jgi:hypothetical protein